MPLPNRSALTHESADDTAVAASTTDSATGPYLRTLIALAGMFSLFQFQSLGPRLLIPGIGIVLALLCVVTVAMRSRGRHDPRVGLYVLMIGVAAGVALLAGRSEFVTSGWPLTSVVPLVLAVSAAVAIGSSGRRAQLGFAALVTTYAVLVLGDLNLLDVRIDVGLLTRGGLDALFSGSSPYGITIVNPYNAAETAQYYGPGAVVDGRVQVGYPYLPAPLLLDIPAYLLGDARWMHLVALIGAGVVAWTLSSDRIGRAASVLLIANPLSSTVVVAYWVEPVMVLLIALSAAGMLRGHRWTGVALGLFFASKQYAVSYVPTLWSVARSSGWWTVWVASTLGVVVVGAFALWDVDAFMHSVVEFQFNQPLRDDALSLLPGLAQLFGPLPEWLLTVSPLIGLMVSLLVALRTRPGATAFLLGIGLSLLVTVLLSKQAFMNYYSLIGAALLLAVITWPSDDPIPEPTPEIG